MRPGLLQRLDDEPGPLGVGLDEDDAQAVSHGPAPPPCAPSDRDLRQEPVARHRIARPRQRHPPAPHHHETVGEVMGKVEILLDQHDRHVAPVATSVGFLPRLQSVLKYAVKRDVYVLFFLLVIVCGAPSLVLFTAFLGALGFELSLLRELVYRNRFAREQAGRHVAAGMIRPIK